MTVGELKSALSGMPDDNIVQIYDPYNNMSYEIEVVEKGDESITSEKGYVFIGAIEE